MEFEYDEAKSQANLEKHGIGIDFEAAQALWNDAQRIEIPARTEDEPRSLVIGRIGGKHWSAVTTPREGRTRIVSVRRSRDEEKILYGDIDEG